MREVGNTKREKGLEREMKREVESESGREMIEEGGW